MYCEILHCATVKCQTFGYISNSIKLWIDAFYIPKAKGQLHCEITFFAEFYSTTNSVWFCRFGTWGICHCTMSELSAAFPRAFFGSSDSNHVLLFCVYITSLSMLSHFYAPLQKLSQKRGSFSQEIIYWKQIYSASLLISSIFAHI